MSKTKNKTKEAPNIANICESLAALFNQIVKMSPLGDGYLSLSISASGYHETKTPTKIRAYFGRDCSFEVETLEELKYKLATFSPEAVRFKRIADLEKELSELKSPGVDAERRAA